MYGTAYNTTDGDLELSSAIINTFDVSTATYSQSFAFAAYQSVPNGIAFNTDGTKMFICGTNEDTIQQWTLSTAFDVSTSNSVVNLNISANETQSYGIAFNTDGTRMFILGIISGGVMTYNLSAFDISTATYSSVFSLGSYLQNFTGITFNPDGTKMYVVAYNSAAYGVLPAVHYFTLTSAFTPSTATHISSFSFASQTTEPRGIAFNPSGTIMNIVDDQYSKILYYTLSTPFVPTTATYTGSISISSQDTSPSGIAFNNDGTRVYITGAIGSDVNEYNLGSFVSASGYQPVHTTNSIDSTYWTDINSMTADQAAGNGNIYYAISTDDRTTWSVIKDVGGERDIVKNNAGTWQYNSNSTYASETWAAGTTNTELATIAEAMGTAQNQMDKTQLDAVTDPNHIVLGNDLDLSIILNLTSGTTVPSSNGVAINYDATVLNKGAILGTDYDFDAPATNKVRITALAANNLKVRVL
tara:strand:- start:95 stop:1510 length:1416 start_codon:yes stop_codon:yes gene_type:complete